MKITDKHQTLLEVREIVVRVRDRIDAITTVDDVFSIFVEEVDRKLDELDDDMIWKPTTVP